MVIYNPVSGCYSVLDMLSDDRLSIAQNLSTYKMALDYDLFTDLKCR